MCNKRKYYLWRIHKGGGIYYEECNQFPLVENSIIENNESESFGGGISIGFSNTVVSNTIIRNNKTTQGAGLEIHQDNGVLLESLLITNNTSDVFYAVGGGIASRQANFYYE